MSDDDVDDIDDVAGMVSVSIPEKRGRPPRNSVWQCFEVLPGRDGLASRRDGAKCIYCKRKYNDARIPALQRHITTECRSVPAGLRNNLVQLIASTRVDLSTPVTQPRKRAKEQQELTQHFEGAALQPALEKELDLKVLLFFVMNNIPFRVAESPFWLSLIQTLRPRYMPPGYSKLRMYLLNQEHAHVVHAFNERLKHETTVTITIDGWSNINNESVYACNVIFANRSTHLLRVLVLSKETHTSDYIAGVFRECIDAIGATKIVALVTDNAANMVKARRLLVAQSGYTHILELRCYMHGFYLAMGSCASHPWAKQTITEAQKIVTYFRASHRPLPLLLEAARAQDIPGTLLSSNKTRFTSVHKCLESVLRMEPALQLVQRRYAVDIKSKPVLRILSDREFWFKLAIIVKLLQPFSEIIMAIQAETATLADVTRYWLYLAKEIKAQSRALEADFKEHLISAFNTRVKEMDTSLSRLALFLDPRFKGAADTRGKFQQLLSTALDVMQKRGHSEQECQRLLGHMQEYKNSLHPFNMPCAGATFNHKAWWQSIDSEPLEIITLALVLHDIVPHAAAPERTFSLMGWFHNDKRNRLKAETTGMLTTIKMHHERLVPKVAKPAAAPTTGTSDDGAWAQSSLIEDDDPEDAANADELESALNEMCKGIDDTEFAEYTTDLDSAFLDSFVLDHPTLTPGYVPTLQAGNNVRIGAHVGSNSFDKVAMLSRFNSID